MLTSATHALGGDPLQERIHLLSMCSASLILLIVLSAVEPTPPQGGWVGVEGGKKKKNEKRIAKRL